MGSRKWQIQFEVMPIHEEILIGKPFLNRSGAFLDLVDKTLRLETVVINLLEPEGGLGRIQALSDPGGDGGNDGGLRSGIRA